MVPNEKNGVSNENRHQADRKFRWAAVASRIDAAARPQAGPGTAHYRTRRRRISGHALRSRLREDHGDRGPDYGQVPGHARRACKVGRAIYERAERAALDHL